MNSIQTLKQQLKRTRLIWVSSKATDAAPLLRLGAELDVVSIIGSGKDLGPEVGEFSIEIETGRRYDYDRFGWDDLSVIQSSALTSYILNRAHEQEVLIVPFSSSQMFSNLALSQPNIQIAGNFCHLEQAFNCKPWVEEELMKINIQTVNWKHFVPGSKMPNNPNRGDWLTRLSGSSGGLGMSHSYSIKHLRQTLEYNTSKDIFSVAEFISGAVSLNITGCVFPNGDITIHPISFQIIGPSACTDREFGYSGNDFGRAQSELSKDSLCEIEQITLKIGQWLRTFNYRGAFGVDFLKIGDKILVSELNPRFQASSHLGAQLMREVGLVDVYTDHLLAHLGLVPQERRPGLIDITKSLRPLAQIFCYFTNSRQSTESLPAVYPSSINSHFNIELVPLVRHVQDHSLLFRLICDEIVLNENGSLMEYWTACILEEKEKVYSKLNRFE